MHVLGAAVQGLGVGMPLFSAWHSREAALLKSLRRRLVFLGVDHPHEHGLQSFRRGHAQQIFDDGGNLADVLRAGQWASPVFLFYLDYNDIEHSAVIDSWCLGDGDD